ncbi:Uncharacterized protein TCM_038528 [Theobroma cacao]|uniref:Endonuclease/exonuclease/phosphatase domain-containing protein n=1 Tax=Theobroma cacao TaxID=3641 RepID=A0A061GP05_THECC|nr:Uncharacterized protein TCM_038528 [Theobroma cacao]
MVDNLELGLTHRIAQWLPGVPRPNNESSTRVAPRKTNSSQKIWIFHSFDISYEVILTHNQCLHVSLSFPWLECLIRATFVYAKCTRTERIPLWTILRSLSVDIHVPWLVGGDFNVILNRAKRLYGASSHTRSMDDFATTLLDCGLVVGGFKGNTYTWTNSHMFQCLDRIVYNHQWMGLLLITRVQHLNRDGSDHCPLLISCSKATDKSPSSFRFLHAWTHHRDFKRYVEVNRNLPIHGKGLQAFWRKQLRLKQHFKWWNKMVFGDIFHNLKVVENHVEVNEIMFQQEQSLPNRLELNKSYAHFNQLLSMEETFWQQKSGIKWVAEGEWNTRFFHMRVQKKRIKSHVFKVENQDVGENDILCAMPTLQEVKAAVFDIDKNSVAGLNSLSPDDGIFRGSCEGGYLSKSSLDIGNISDVVKAFGVKLWWSFQSCKSLWAQFMRVKYCVGQVPRYVKPRIHDSQTWKRMLMGEEPLVNRFPTFISSMIQVCYFFDNGKWNVEKLMEVLLEELIGRFCKF